MRFARIEYLQEPTEQIDVFLVVRLIGVSDRGFVVARDRRELKEHILVGLNCRHVERVGVCEVRELRLGVVAFQSLEHSAHNDHILVTAVVFFAFFAAAG